jgi:hypothetical protein
MASAGDCCAKAFPDIEKTDAPAAAPAPLATKSRRLMRFSR